MTHPYPKAAAEFPTLRQTALATFDACALSAKFARKYERGWSSHPQARGQITHRVFAKCLEEMAAQSETRVETDVALAILHEVLRQADVDDYCHEPLCELPARMEGGRVVCDAGHSHRSSVVNIPMKEVKDLYWIVVKWATDNEFDTANLIDVEKRLTATLRYQRPKGGNVERVLTGQLDALFLSAADQSEAIVLDWKDTWQLPPATEVSFGGYFQQRFYAWLVMRSYPSIMSVTLREFYVRRSEPREATVLRNHLDDIEDELAALAERHDRAFETENFPPSPGKHCSYCTRPAACPIEPFARGEGRISTAKEAENVAAQLVVAEAVMKQAKAALQAWSDVRGDVPVRNAKGRTVYGFRRSSRMSRPTRAEIEQAMLSGPLDLDRLYRESATTRFGQYTLKPGEGEAEDAEMLAKLQEAVADAKGKAS